MPNLSLWLAEGNCRLAFCPIRVDQPESPSWRVVGIEVEPHKDETHRSKSLCRKGKGFVPKCIPSMHTIFNLKTVFGNALLAMHFVSCLGQCLDKAWPR